MAKPRIAPRTKSFQSVPACASNGEDFGQVMPIVISDRPIAMNAIAVEVILLGSFCNLLRIIVEFSFHCLENRRSTTPPMPLTNSGSRLAATARRAQAVHVHRDGKANEESAECIRPIAI